MTKLVRLLGPERAKPIFAKALARAALTTIATANDLVRFADALAVEGGFIAALAGILRVKAITLGADG